MSNYHVLTGKKQRVPVKLWINEVGLPEEEAQQQLRNIATLPFIHHHIAAMPDVHLGKGATVGSVIPTKGAIIPVAVGVDIGCGMCAVKTSLTADNLPDNLKKLRLEIEKGIPVGNGRGGQWGRDDILKTSERRWVGMKDDLFDITERHPGIVNFDRLRPSDQLCTLGGGNHFIEICLDTEGNVWFMLHSGSRGIGNKIGSYFITRAKEEMDRNFIQLADRDIAYLVEGTDLFDDYVLGVSWAQEYARINRELMMNQLIKIVATHPGIREFSTDEMVVNCHHNYVEQEHHYGSNVYLTRKGAVRAREGDLGIIPGSMGAKSYIVRGKGNRESFHSCSHGAGRRFSRTRARNEFSLQDHIDATEGVECRKDPAVIDETPAAYKDIDAVMASQTDLVEVVATLKQVLCVKG